MRRTLLLTCVFALAVPAASAAPPQSPAFHVAIHATLDAQYDYYSMPSGCTKHETRHVVVKNAKPFTLTAYKLGRSQNFFFDLVATETRSITVSDCSGAAPDSSTCGTVTYTIPSIGTGVGFTSRKSDQFALFYTRIGSDPFAGKCGLGVAPAPGSKVPVWTDNFPPSGLPGTWGPIPGSTKFGNIPGGSTRVTVDRAKLTAHKRFVVQWSESGESQDGGEHEQLAASWQVTLVPVT